MPDKLIGGLAAFIDRKSRAAAAAVLPPYSTELERPLDGMLAIGSAWTERLFDGPFYLSPLPQRLPACHLVFVQSLDGNTGARNPQALGGGETDKHVIYEGLPAYRRTPCWRWSRDGRELFYLVGTRTSDVRSKSGQARRSRTTIHACSSTAPIWHRRSRARTRRTRRPAVPDDQESASEGG